MSRPESEPQCNAHTKSWNASFSNDITISKISCHESVKELRYTVIVAARISPFNVLKEYAYASIPEIVDDISFVPRPESLPQWIQTNSTLPRLAGAYKGNTRSWQGRVLLNSGRRTSSWVGKTMRRRLAISAFPAAPALSAPYTALMSYRICMSQCVQTTGL